MNTNIKYCFVEATNALSIDINSIRDDEWMSMERPIRSNNLHLMPGKYSYATVVQKVRTCASLLGRDDLPGDTEIYLIEAVATLACISHIMDETEYIFIKYV